MSHATYTCTGNGYACTAIDAATLISCLKHNSVTTDILETITAWGDDPFCLTKEIAGFSLSKINRK